ncbi:Hypothetical protein KVN_LOCUS29 [uncultured virus]|nr:Hypothetical protein KVN_LOCUS29 [uncultured virus]
MQINELPKDCLNEIYNHLNLIDFMNFTKVCKQLNIFDEYIKIRKMINQIKICKHQIYKIVNDFDDIFLEKNINYLITNPDNLIIINGDNILVDNILQIICIIAEKNRMDLFKNLILMLHNNLEKHEAYTNSEYSYMHYCIIFNIKYLSKDLLFFMFDFIENINICDTNGSLIELIINKLDNFEDIISFLNKFDLKLADGICKCHYFTLNDILDSSKVWSKNLKIKLS